MNKIVAIRKFLGFSKFNPVHERDDFMDIAWDNNERVSIPLKKTFTQSDRLKILYNFRRSLLSRYKNMGKDREIRDMIEFSLDMAKKILTGDNLERETNLIGYLDLD